MQFHALGDELPQILCLLSLTTWKLATMQHRGDLTIGIWAEDLDTIVRGPGQNEVASRSNTFCSVGLNSRRGGACSFDAMCTA